MNFLAHLHLSYPNTPQMVGNFIGDYVKGQQYRDYPEAIAQGIILHRKIDDFTDHHPLQREFKNYFRAPYRHYAGIISDVLFDYFLAHNWADFSSIALNTFCQSTYRTLESYHKHLPETVQGFLPKMRQAKRLESYAEQEGIASALMLMTRYTSLPDYTVEAMAILNEHYEALEELFYPFYADLMAYVAAEQAHSFEI